MADLLIKGMEMPKGCSVCPIRHRQGSAWCQYLQKWTPDEEEKERLDNCPLVELKPNGELIERDEILEYIEDHETLNIGTLYDVIQDAPTVLEASE